MSCRKSLFVARRLVALAAISHLALGAISIAAESATLLWTQISMQVNLFAVTVSTGPGTT